MKKIEESPPETTEPAEFPVTMTEFLSELPNGKVEMQAGFKYACAKENIGGSMLRKEWQTLLDKYNTQPVDTPLRPKGGKQ